MNSRKCSLSLEEKVPAISCLRIISLLIVGAWQWNWGHDDDNLQFNSLKTSCAKNERILRRIHPDASWWVFPTSAGMEILDPIAITDHTLARSQGFLCSAVTCSTAGPTEGCSARAPVLQGLWLQTECEQRVFSLPLFMFERSSKASLLWWLEASSTCIHIQFLWSWSLPGFPFNLINSFPAWADRSWDVCITSQSLFFNPGWANQPLCVCLETFLMALSIPVNFSSSVPASVSLLE